MGGRAAEELIFNQQTTGAQGDLLTATRIATDMICKWGMSGTFGPQAFSIESGGFIAGAGGRLPMSDDTARLIDQEVHALLASCYEEAVRILTQQRALLEDLAEILLQVETLDGEEFAIIVNCSATKEATTEKSENDCTTCSVKEHCSDGQSKLGEKVNAITT
jgi:cell division protease FtsH